jgi:hypothetical protein
MDTIEQRTDQPSQVDQQMGTFEGLTEPAASAIVSTATPPEPRHDQPPPARGSRRSGPAGRGS